MSTTTLALSELTADPDIQQRTTINDALVAEYAENIAEWQATAELTVFYDGEIHWLADGFHRFAAAKQAGMERVFVKIKNGVKRDAIRHSLGANANHGMRRNQADLARAYATAVEHELCSATDAKAVAALLGCSERHARALTAEARNAEKEFKIAEIHRLASAGNDQREISDRVGLSVGTVNAALVQKRKCSEIEHAPEVVLTVENPLVSPERAALTEWQVAILDALTSNAFMYGADSIQKVLNVYQNERNSAV